LKMAIWRGFYPQKQEAGLKPPWRIHIKVRRILIFSYVFLGLQEGSL
jgi:hypothetical protein